MAEEKIIYQDTNVSISNARAIFSGTTYPTAHITSVSVKSVPPSRSGSIFLLLAGLGILFIVCVVGIPLVLAKDSNWLMIAIGAAIFGLLAIVVLGGGIYGLIKAKPTYVLVIRSASGEQRALISKNKDYILKVLDAVNQAIVERG